MDLTVDAVIVALVPGIVEVAKRAGLPVRFAGLVAILAATVLIALRDLASRAGGPAEWLLGGIIAGLAAAGLYTQTRLIRRP